MTSVLDLPASAETVTAEPTSIARGRVSFLEFKRLMDFTLALAMLLLFAPFLFFIAVVIEGTSRGPAFYVQWRVGRRGRLFRMYKLRTMVMNAEEASGPVWCKDDDPRITGIGRILRATHLDELPQLINVLRGEMSLVGPRPERPVFVRNFTRAIPNYAARLEVRPGITGLAQVCQGYDHSLRDVKRKLAYDLIYIRRMCWLVDLRIVLATLRQAVPTGAAKAAA
jgi:lipopolysaccharide/colanic/teichoic acid biosynthesis glycosyltransferase